MLVCCKLIGSELSCLIQYFLLFWKASSWWLGRMWCRERAAGIQTFCREVFLQRNCFLRGKGPRVRVWTASQRSRINQIWEQTRTQRSHPTLFIQTFLTKTQISQRNVITAIHPEARREPIASVCQLKYQLTDHREGSVMVGFHTDLCFTIRRFGTCWILEGTRFHVGFTLKIRKLRPIFRLYHF